MNMEKKPIFNRQAKAGTYTAVITLVLLAVLVVVNLLVSALPSQYTVIDTSTQDLYTLSATTEQSVGMIDEPITIYYIATPAGEDFQLLTFVERYASLSKNITLKKLDPTVNPTFTAQYTDAQLSENSLIVESARRYKVIDYTEIYPVEVDDPYTYMMMGGAGGYSVSFAGENAITGALDFVTTDKLPTIYTLMGHGETALDDSLTKQLQDANLAVESLSLLTMDAVPEDADCIMIYAPTSDISTHEKDLLTAYLAAGGHMMLLTEFNYDPQLTPNLAALTSHYGITGETGVVMEGNNRAYYQVPYYIIPQVGTHEITAELAQSSYAFMIFAHGLTVQENLRSGLTVTPLLYTTDSAFVSPVQNGQASTVKGEGVQSRSYGLAVAAEEAVEGGTAKLVWISGAQMLTAEANQVVSGGNYAYVQSMLDWMCEREQVVTLPAIVLEDPVLMVNDGAANTLAVILTAVLPLLTVAGGFLYWMRRRRR